MTTVDGLPVRVGMRVWFVHPWGLLTKKKLDKTDLGAWWSTRTKDRIYSTERAAIEAAIVKRRTDLSRAKRDASTATKAIAKLQARLAAASGDDEQCSRCGRPESVTCCAVPPTQESPNL